MSIKKIYLKALPLLIAIPVAGLYLMGTSDYDDQMYVEQLKQEQREYVQGMAATHAAHREFYQIEEINEVPNQIFAQR